MFHMAAKFISKHKHGIAINAACNMCTGKYKYNILI